MGVRSCEPPLTLEGTRSRWGLPGTPARRPPSDVPVNESAEQAFLPMLHGSPTGRGWSALWTRDRALT